MTRQQWQFLKNRKEARKAVEAAYARDRLLFGPPTRTQGPNLLHDTTVARILRLRNAAQTPAQDADET